MNELTYFAQIDENNVVLAVHIVSREFIDENPERYPGLWVETYRDAPNKTYAGEGYVYDPKENDFYLPKPIEI